MEACHSCLRLDASHNASFSTSSPFNMLTGPRWWIVGLVYHRHDYNWVEPMLLWMITTIRILTFYIPARYALVYVSCTEPTSFNANISSDHSNSVGAMV